MTEQEMALWAEFERASKKVKQCLVFINGGPGAENEYAVAYNNLVRAGLAMPLKKKYR